MTIYFYKEFGDNGYLASYSPHGFYKDGVYWKTVEHYYQAQKFENEDIKKQIIAAATPREASDIGRKREYVIKTNWDEIRCDVMFEAVLCKFRANEDIRNRLIDTGEEDIVEETQKENFWGCGPMRDGKNMYGKILCQVRGILAKEKEEKILYGKVLY